MEDKGEVPKPPDGVHVGINDTLQFQAVCTETPLDRLHEAETNVAVLKVEVASLKGWVAALEGQVKALVAENTNFRWWMMGLLLTAITAVVGCVPSLIEFIRSKL